MSKEKDKLLNMFKEKKISEKEYKFLSDALDKKSSLDDIESSILLNPFKKVAGMKALMIGVVIMVLMSLLGVAAKMYLDGIFGSVLAFNINTPIKPSFYLLMYQNIVSCLVLSSLFFMSAIFFNKKRMRYIDFLGMVTLSRYPFIILVGCTAFIQTFFPEFYKMDTTHGYEMHFSILRLIDHLFFMTCFIWQIMTYFFALKEASGLEGRRLWISYLVAICLSDVLSTILSRIFLYT
ncbi:MAG: hypothetical protein ABSF18_07065 [Gammaproteobacteria bacterium]